MVKKPEKFSGVGRFGEWAYKQTVADNGGKEVDLKKIRRVEVVPETSGEAKNFWRVESRGELLLVPECYPIQIIGSIFEETKGKIKRGREMVEVSLLDQIRNSRDGTIDWSSVEGEDMWSTYASRLGKAGTIWDFLQGKNLIKWGDDDQMRLWVETANNALSQFGRVKEASIKRWMLYASTGINSNKRSPHLNDRGRRMDILGNLSQKDANYLPNEQLLFPWDRGWF